MKKSKTYYTIKFILFFIVVSSITGLCLFKIYNELHQYDVKLIGDEKVLIAYNKEYSDNGFEIYNNKTKMDNSEAEYDIKSTVDTSKIGEYTVEYSINFRGHVYTLIRNVEVKDMTAPVIEVESDTIERNYCTKELPSSIEYTATDDVEGDVTNSIERIDGEDTITLKVKDSSGNESEKVINVITADKPSNKIKLNGKSKVSVLLDSKYTEQGAYITDGCENKLDNEEIEITGSVDTSKTGNYTITYTSKSDKDLNTTRTVKVYKSQPAVQAPFDGKSVIYLTFDDGPGAYTQQILNTLDKYNIKATFFVTNQFPKYQHMIGEEARRGHTVAVHTLTHKWSIYDSVDAYMTDFNAMNNIIEQQTGKKTKYFRFPGGSSNTVSKGHSIGIMSTLANKMTNEGYKYYDWNVSVEDAGSCVKASDKQTCVYNYFKNYVKPGRENIVLLHDIKSYSAASLEKMIQYGLNNGYTFKAIDDNTTTVHFKIAN